MDALADSLAERRFRIRGRLLALALVVLTICFHVWIISAGWWTHWPSVGAYYDKLAGGFLKGQLSLAEKPSAELMALSDPYDPKLNQGFRLHDAVLYEGRYYLYWGPLPGLLLVPAKFFRPTPAISDEYLVFVMDLLMVVSWTLLLMRIRERLFPGITSWAIVPPLLTAASVGMLTYALARPWVYEVAVIGGQAFLTAGIYCTFEALVCKKPRVRWRWLVLAGSCCGCALACRVSLILAVAALAVAVAWRLWQTRERTAPRGLGWLGGIVALASPVALTVAILGVYNIARFGSPTEFGLRYQLAGIYSKHTLGDMFSTRYIVPNTYRALVNDMVFDRGFPFVRPSGRGWIVYDHFISEPMAGVLLTSPFLLFALVPPIAALSRRRTGRNDADQFVRADVASARTAVHGLEQWLGLTLATVTVLSFLPAAAILASSPRYVIELATPASLLAGLGLFQVALRTSGRTGAWCLGTLVTLALLYALAIGFLMGTQGEGGHLRRENPALYRSLGGSVD